jgi:prefoldin alpha subunit
MEDGELRQAMAALEAYNKQIENLGRQAQLLQATMDDLLRARETLKALKNAKAGDEVLLPIGGSSFVNVQITADTKVIVGIGSQVSVEKTIDETLEFIKSSGDECSESLGRAANAMSSIENMANELSEALQNEYRSRQTGQ